VTGVQIAVYFTQIVTHILQKAFFKHTLRRENGRIRED
jgi:hypothetical protein